MMLIFTVILVLLLVIDWAQTRFIAKHPELFSEINIVLGKHPSIEAVNLYFVFCIVGIVILGHGLSEMAAMVGGGMLIALEVFITVRNYKLGVRMQ